MSWPILLPLWLRMDLQARWDGASALIDLARGMVREELLKRLNAVDADLAVDEITEAHAQAGAAMMRATELEKHIFSARVKGCLRCRNIGRGSDWCKANCSADHKAWEPKEEVS